jgi:hypothetical protein
VSRPYTRRIAFCPPPRLLYAYTSAQNTSAQTDRRLKITEIQKITPKHIGIAVYITQTKYIKADKTPLHPPVISLASDKF